MAEEDKTVVPEKDSDLETEANPTHTTDQNNIHFSSENSKSVTTSGDIIDSINQKDNSNVVSVAKSLSANDISLNNQQTNNGSGHHTGSTISTHSNSTNNDCIDCSHTNSTTIDIDIEAYEQLQEDRDRIKKELEVLTAKHQEVIRQLKETCCIQQEQLEKSKEEIEKERESLESCQDELNRKLHELADSQSNQEAIMARIVVLDMEKIKLLDEQVSLERKNKDVSKENERLQSLLKMQKGEINKLSNNKEKNESKVSEQSSELKKLTDQASSVTIKLKWAQNKLKSETEEHKGTKNELSSTTKKLKQAREETEQIRQDLKKMIAQYQDSEEMKSNTLDSKLKKKEEELMHQEQEIADQIQLHELTVKELQLSKDSLEISQKECVGLKTRVAELTNQITEKQVELDELKGTLSKEKKEQKKLHNEIDSMKEMNKDIDKERQTYTALRESHAHLQKTHHHLEREVSRRKEKETELLSFSEKLSSSNAQLTADKGMLEGQSSVLEEKVLQLNGELNTVKKRKEELESELSELRISSEMDRSLSIDQLHSKSLAVEQLTISLEEEREQNAALRRKHANNIKDMQRQIQLYSKRVEQLESNHVSGVATLQVDNLGMRTLSHGSLDGSTSNLHVSTYPNNHSMSSPDEPSSPTLKVQGMFETLDQEKTLLVEKICQLNKKLVRREERIEFFEGHTSQLTEDLKKKSRIIQNYIVRDESGALVPPEADVHKEKFRRRSGIMASVFSGSAHKGSPEMTLAMSMEINRKMQAVLEDILIKNITLKESLETLGQEIARLSTQLNSYHKSSPGPPPPGK